MAASDRPIDRWMRALEARHLADLRFAEVVRALRTLSSAYVQRRSRLDAGAALDGAGKRAAFALFYGPLHFLIVSRILESLGPTRVNRVLDLGCGTGVAGIAWALADPIEHRPALLGIDRHPWAVAEARWTYKTFSLRGRVEQRDLSRAGLPGNGGGVVAAYALNEVDDKRREKVLDRCVEVARRGARILIVEPIAQGVTPWWPHWRRVFENAGGRGDEWRFELELPDLVRRLDRAAGLDHRELTAKSLWL
jgi:SAM-dependent methyltransferase